MSASKTPLSGATSYAEIGEYWDEHDLSDHWDKTREVEMEIDIQSSSVYFAVERSLADKLRTAARSQGVSPETLLNLWVQEHVANAGNPK
jgi:hypothetical protein